MFVLFRLRWSNAQSLFGWNCRVELGNRFSGLYVCVWWEWGRRKSKDGILGCKQQLLRDLSQLRRKSSLALPDVGLLGWLVSPHTRHPRGSSKLVGLSVHRSVQVLFRKFSLSLSLAVHYGGGECTYVSDRAGGRIGVGGESWERGGVYLENTTHPLNKTRHEQRFFPPPATGPQQPLASCLMANTREGKVLLRVSLSVKRTFGVTGTKMEKCTSEKGSNGKASRYCASVCNPGASGRELRGGLQCCTMQSYPGFFCMLFGHGFTSHYGYLRLQEPPTYPGVPVRIAWSGAVAKICRRAKAKNLGRPGRAVGMRKAGAKEIFKQFALPVIVHSLGCSSSLRLGGLSVRHGLASRNKTSDLLCIFAPSALRLELAGFGNFYTQAFHFFFFCSGVRTRSKLAFRASGSGDTENSVLYSARDTEVRKLRTQFGPEVKVCPSLLPGPFGRSAACPGHAAPGPGTRRSAFLENFPKAWSSLGEVVVKSGAWAWLLSRSFVIMSTGLDGQLGTEMNGSLDYVSQGTSSSLVLT
ncbi:uncharacterized protein CLUP02_06059 [Colletotrichum lupini]|uniref:Uncharacterized protein n=1 Tax=Colletotrichum lupini TaxID=145971 RepID=A0A9Q8SPJ3_9PEZI|nr:uncharacterized protein CLUP02_06059 [Colletotrichum lupini]UQC80576.1 hypothetical protein CLUP02_06059 [Colletotrichum lupini]